MKATKKFMSEPIRVFVPEWVPLDNKGEEAIIYGLIDGLFPDREVEVTVLEQNIDKPMRRDGLRVWPHSWFYSPWRNRPFSLSFTPKDMFNSSMSLLRHTLEVLPQWVRRPPAPVRRFAQAVHRFDAGLSVKRTPEYVDAVRDVANMDYIIAGHDGVLSYNEECHVIQMLIEAGFSYGVYGTCLPLPLRTPHVRSLYRRTFEQAQYFYTRNPGGVEWARAHLPGLDVRSAPDPAFAMKPAPAKAVQAIIEHEGLTSFFESPVVMMTVVENDVTMRFAFKKHRSAQAKLRKHLDFLAELVTYLVETKGANVLFLPHCIGPSRRADDRRVARDVISRAHLSEDRVRILNSEYDARELKGLVGRADLLVAERIHSLIGAIGVHTPFLCLGSQSDDRCTGIIGELCGCGDLVYSMDYPAVDMLRDTIDRIWSARADIRTRIKTLSDRMAHETTEVRQHIRSAMSRGRERGGRPGMIPGENARTESGPADTVGGPRSAATKQTLSVLFQIRPDAFTKFGGDTYQMQQYRQHLEKLGVRSDVCTALKPRLDGVDLVHLFNLDRPMETYAQMRWAQRHGTPVVVSTIHRPNAEVHTYQRCGAVPLRLLRRACPSDEAFECAKDLCRVIMHNAEWGAWQQERRLGRGAIQREIVREADGLCLLAKVEGRTIENDFGVRPKRVRVVRNGLDAHIEPVPLSAEVEQRLGGVDDFVLSAGRIESGKNPIAVLRAVRRIGKPVVFVGGTNRWHKGYFRQFRRVLDQTPDAVYLGRVDPTQMPALYRRARVHVLASRLEASPLVDLEAAWWGCHVVTTTRSYAPEYAPDFATFCDPDDLDALCAAIASAYRAPKPEPHRSFLAERFSWRTAAEQLKEYYSEILAAHTSAAT